jgi:hypothetical protein
MTVGIVRSRTQATELVEIMLALIEERMLQSYPQKHDLDHKCPSLAIENNGYIFSFFP